MAITATLIGGSVPQLVQVVVSATAAGVPWTLTGSAAGVSWTVPGGSGVGDGNPLVRVDNRAPLNADVVYTYTPATGSPQVAAPVSVSSAYGIVIQSLDGQQSIPGDLLDGSDAIELQLNQAVFNIPGRSRPAVRYAVTGDGGGALNVGLEQSATEALRALVRSGSPVLVRRQPMDDDLPLVFVALLTGISGRLAIDIGYRQWSLPYLLLDDPFLDVALGAFAWDYFDTRMSGRSWNTFDTNMAGRSWNTFDALDWATV